MYNQEWRRTRRLIGFGVLALLAVFVTAMIVFMFVVGPRVAPTGPYMFFPFGFGWIGGFFLIFLFFGLFRWFLFPWGWHYGYRYGYGNGRYRDESYSILRERYARGEITKDQYDQMMRDLETPAHPPQ